jgi:hypothetical protein
MMLSLNEQMSLPCISSSELELLDNRIKVFLHKYKEVFGHVAMANSKVGLKKIKFHASKQHCVFYIKRYGSSDNTFGGTLESALKSTVKLPTKRTSRRHDHLCKELAARQHDRFCISQSSLENSMLMLDFVLHTSSNRKRQWIDCDHTDSSLHTTLPHGWSMHKSVFSLSKRGDEWSTHHGKKTFFNQIVYPNFVSTIVGQTEMSLIMVNLSGCSELLKKQMNSASCKLTFAVVLESPRNKCNEVERKQKICLGAIPVFTPTLTCDGPGTIGP